MSQAATLASPGRIGLRQAAFVGALLLVWISTAPFKSGPLEAFESGNIVNQLAFSGMAAVCAALVWLRQPRVLTAYLHPLYILTIGWLLVTVMASDVFDVSLRAALFTLVVITIAACLLTLPDDEAEFADLLAVAVLIVVGVCYAGVLLKVAGAVHDASDVAEPEHAGSWKGVYDHKNIAGPMMAIFMMAGFYVAEARSRLVGFAIVVLAGAFLFMTNSKTAMALGPFVALLAFAVSLTERRWLRTLIAFGPLVVMLAMTVGTVLSAELKALLEMVSPGQTFTGRTELWDFAIRRMPDHLIFGYGPEGFWGTDMVRLSEPAEGAQGIAAGMMHAHNSYVDAAVSMGLPGLALTVLVLVVLPYRDWMRARPTPANQRMALLFVRIWLMCLYGACLESFFFRRADPVWFALLISVLGLRLVATWPVRERS